MAKTPLPFDEQLEHFNLWFESGLWLGQVLVDRTEVDRNPSMAFQAFAIKRGLTDA